MFLLRDLPAPYSALTSEILRQPSALDELTREIGFDRISARGKSRSYVSRCGGKVIKVSYGDEAYHHFSQYALRHRDDPHMPRFDFTIMIPGRTGLYVMEYLTENTLPERFRDFVIAQDLGEFAMRETRRDAARFRAMHPTFCASLDAAYAAKPDWYANDLSRANIRMRGETPVILDPWC